MTRQCFIDEITTWSELIDFCYNEDCDICEDIIDSDTMDEEVNENLREDVGNYSWWEVRDGLNDIETGYDYYHRNDGLFDYEPMDDSDFDSYKEDVIEWMDNGGYWDEEDDEDEEYEEPFHDNQLASEDEDGEDESEPEDEDFSVDELIGMCSVQFLGIQREAAKRRRQNDKEFEQYLNNMPKVLH